MCRFNYFPFVFFLLFSIGAVGQTIYDWEVTAPDGNWRQGIASGPRWNPMGLWDEPDFGVLRFNNNHQPTMTNNVPGTYSMHGMIFGSSNNSSARTIGGNTLRLFDFGGNDPYIQNDSPLIHTLSLPIEGDDDAGDPLVIRINNVGLNFAGSINNQGSAINVIGTTSNASTVNFSGILSGSGGLYKENANITVELDAANTYTGQTTAQAGTIRLLNIDGLGNSSGNTVVLAGGTVELAAGANYNSGENLVLNGDGSAGQGALRKTDTGTREFSGDLLVDTDAEIEVIGGTLDFRGELDFDSNTATFDGSQNFTFGSGSTFINANKTTGFGAINKTGSGILTVRPTTNLTGNIRVNGGEFRQATGSYPSSGQITLENGVTYRSDGSASRNIAKATLVTGNVTLGSGIGATGQLDFLSTVDFFTLNRTLTMTNDNFITGEMTNGSFTKAGTGSLTIQGSTANTLSDGSIVDDGTLILAKDAGLNATAGLIINSSGTVETQNDNQWGAAAPPFIQIFGGVLDVNNTDQRLALAGDATASVTLGTGTTTIDGTGTDIFAGVISGTGGLIKEGSGTEILNGTNTYSGNTTISDGTLQLGASNVLADASDVVLDGGTLRSTTTITETMGTLDLAASSAIDLGGTGETLTFTNSNAVVWDINSTLTILGWTGTAELAGTGSRIFLSTSTGLTADQLLQIQFDGYDFGARILGTGELVPAIQNVTRFDNFNRGQSDAVGNPSGGNPGTWQELENPSANCTAGTFVEINASNQLQLTRGSGGTCSASSEYKLAAFDISGEYSTIFRDANAELVWHFNFRQSDGTPSPQNRTAFVIGCSESDFTSATASGYAVVMGDQGVSPADAFKLIHFSSGIPTGNDFSSNEIVSIVNPGTTSHFSIRVSFDPCSNTWSLAVRDDGGSFKDPGSISTTGSSAVDITNVDLDMPYLGVYRRHSGTGTRSSLFDNIYTPKEPAATIDYVWNGGNGDYQVSTNWTPTRTCTRGGDILRFNSGGTSIVSNVPDETIGQLIVESNSIVILRDEADPGPGANLSTLTITGRASGTDLEIANGSTLRLDVPNTVSGHAINLSLLSGATAEVFGSLEFIRSFGSNTPRHKLLGEDFESIRIKSTGAVRAIVLSAASNEHPFGRLLPNEIVVFESGSVYESNSGNNPFGSTAPDSKVRFESGSIYRHLGNHGFSYGGRQYADFEYQNSSSAQTLTFGTSSGWNMENFRVLQGSLTLAGNVNALAFDLNISGDFEVAAGATLNYTPTGPLATATSTLNLNGSDRQIITGSGTLTFNDRVNVEINNTYGGGGYAVEVQRDLDLFSDLSVNDGVVEGLGGATISMSGADATFLVNEDVNGTGVGVGRDLNLEITSGLTTLQGNSSNCDFLNIDVADNATLALERGIEAVFGNFNVGNNSTLQVNAGGFVDSGNPSWVAPQYQISSQLIYNSGGAYNRGNEWVQNTTAADPGFPSHVIVQNGTTLNTVATQPLGCEGDLEIGSAQGAGIFNLNTDQPLQVSGNVLLGVSGNTGILNLTGGVGGDLFIAGNFTKNGDDAVGVLNQNSREIVMNGSAVQNISGINTLSLLGIDNSGSSVTINEDLLITNRLRLSDGTFNLGAFDLTMDDNTELQRTATAATISSEPLVIASERYNISYLAAVTTDNEWSSDNDAVRDVYLNQDITIGGNRALNRDLNIDGANIDLNGNTLRLRGRNTSAGQFSGDITISQSGERQINGTGTLLVNGLGGTDPGAGTKRVVSSGGATIRFSSDTEVSIGDGGFDFGAGNPSTLDGELTILGGGFVDNNSCFYSTNSLLRFSNGFDYQVNATDLTWAQGAVGQAGVPYNVESIGAATTDLTLNAPRTLANNLNIENALFTLTASSGTFRIGGNWTRDGGNFVHNDQAVIFHGISPQTQTISTTGGETFYELSFENSASKTLSQDVTVLNNLNIRNGGNLDGGSSTAFINGNWNNEISEAAFTENTGTVVFQGSTTQDIDCPGGERFHDLTVNNTATIAIDLEDETRVSGTLTMTDGILRTQGNNFILTNGSSISGGSTATYVDGAITKIGTTNGVEITFPVGDYRDDLVPIRDVYQPVGLILAATNLTAEFDVEYFHDNYTPGFTNPNNPPPTDASIESASTCNYWMIDRIVGSVNAQIRLYWNTQSCLTVDEASDITVARWTGPNPGIGAWDNQAETGVTPATGVAPSGNVRSGVVSIFSPFTLASTSPNTNVLPITLLSFHAEATGNQIKTTWITASEINNDFFAIERSKDGSSWEEVGRVDGAGNSNTELSYSFVDERPYAGISYYRLRQTDFDGTTTVSDIRAVEILQGDDFGLDRVYRGTDGLNLVYRSTAPYVVAEIYDLLGKRIHGELLENYGNGFSTIHPDLARGAYILRLSHGSEMDTEKFVW